MSTRAQHPQGIGALLHAVDAIWDRRAMIVMCLALLGAALIGGALAASRQEILGALLAIIITFVGINACGVVLMANTVGGEPVRVGDALIAGLVAAIKLVIVLILGLILVALLWALVAALVWACKMPGLGPILFLFVAPLGTVVLGIAVAALVATLLPIGAPALWAGEGILQALSRIFVVSRKKLVNVIILISVLLLIVSVAAGIVFFILGIGAAGTGSLAVGLLGAGANVGLGGNALAGLQTAGPYATTGTLGAGVLFALALLVPGLILGKGFCLIYLQVTEELDFSGAEHRLRQGIEQVRQRAKDARQRVEQRGAASSPDHPGPGMRQSAPPTTMTCPNCRAPITAGDAFCGNCGGRLA